MVGERRGGREEPQAMTGEGLRACMYRRGGVQVGGGSGLTKPVNQHWVAEDCVCVCVCGVGGGMCRG